MEPTVKIVLDLPCPFCGSADDELFVEWKGGPQKGGESSWISAWIGCKECGAKGGFNSVSLRQFPDSTTQSGLDKAVAIAIKKWDTRAIPSVVNGG